MSTETTHNQQAQQANSRANQLRQQRSSYSMQLSTADSEDYEKQSELKGKIAALGVQVTNFQTVSTEQKQLATQARIKENDEAIKAENQEQEKILEEQQKEQQKAEQVRDEKSAKLAEKKKAEINAELNGGSDQDLLFVNLEGEDSYRPTAPQDVVEFTTAKPEQQDALANENNSNNKQGEEEQKEIKSVNASATGS